MTAAGVSQHGGQHWNSLRKTVHGAWSGLAEQSPSLEKGWSASLKLSRRLNTMKSLGQSPIIRDAGRTVSESSRVLSGYSGNKIKPLRRTYMHLVPRPRTCVTVPLRPRPHPVVLTPLDNFTAQYTVCDCRALRYRPTCHSKRMCYTSCSIRPVALHSNFITCQHNAPEELLRRHTLGMATLSHRGDQPDPTQSAE